MGLNRESAGCFTYSVLTYKYELNLFLCSCVAFSWCQYMAVAAEIPAFEICDQVGLNSVCSATETSYMGGSRISGKGVRMY